MNLVTAKYRLSACLLAAGLAVAVLTGCSRAKADGRPVLAVSIEPERFLLEQIAGPEYRVVTVLDPGANPETFEPSMRTRGDIARAEAYFAVGGLPFEAQLRGSDSGLKFYSVSEGIEPVYGTHDDCPAHAHDQADDDHDDADAEDADHDHGQGDPHTWTSVKNARVMARNMYQRLVQLNPQQRAQFTDRYRRLDARLDSLDRAVSARLAPVRGQSFVVWHPSLSYFARDYGLKQISIGWESKEASPTALRHAIDTGRESGARVFFLQREFDSRQAKSVNAEMGMTEVVIDPMSYDWMQQINLIANELSKR